MFEKGKFVILNGQIGVVVETPAAIGSNLNDHTAVWFGLTENGKPEIWTVPAEYLCAGPRPIVKH